MDLKAEERIINSKSICSSGDTAITYPKKNPPSQIEERLYWQDIHAAEEIAVLDYRMVYDCSKADLILRINLDVLSDQVLLTVTDADSGEAVFTESRSIQDKRNDLIRAAKHFREAVAAAKRSIVERQEAVENAKHDREREQQTKCDATANSLRNRIALQPSDPTLLQNLVNEIQSYNSACPNEPINPETVTRLEKTSKEAQEKAAREQDTRQKRAAQLEKEKSEALTAYMQLLSSSPFVPPLNGWSHEARLPNSRCWIIPPGITSPNCRFTTNGRHPALVCLGNEKSEDYVSVLNNERWYLLKAKNLKKSDDLVTTVKDGGATLCLQQLGCYRVLAEVRQEPTGLPEKFSVPAPSTETSLYENDEFWLHYPQNWHVNEQKDKDGKINQVSLADSSAHLGRWYTHGAFVGHVRSMAKGYPSTLDGAFAQSTEFYRTQVGMTFTEGSTFDLQIGGQPARLIVYSQPSIFTTPERGYVIIVKDKGDGYYFLLMFMTGNEENPKLWQETFTAIYKSIQFK